MPIDYPTSAVIIMGLQTFGKPAAEVAKNFVNTALGQLGTEVGKDIAQAYVDWKARRAERFVGLLNSAAHLIHDAGREPEPVPPYLLVPLMEKGSLVVDEDLRAVWAHLLASAATNSPDCEVWPSFPQILSELSSGEARVLGWVYEQYAGQPHGLYVGARAGLWAYFHKNSVDYPQAAVMEDNFVRLRLLAQPHPVMRGEEVGKTVAQLIETKGRGILRDLKLEDNRVGDLRLTALGIAFLRACAGPRRREDGV